jgi:predicted amidohydrolase YtcJ
MTRFLPLISLLILTFTACEKAEVADIIFLNGNFYTVNENQPRASVIAIKNGRIIGVGDDEVRLKHNGPSTEIKDLNGAFAMPGFIEGHAHFSGLGNSLMNLNFLKSKNWNEIVDMVAERAKTAKKGEWITGRGWHQEKWNESPEKQVLGYPYHYELSDVSPDNPVVLRHASGHSLFANKAAMDLVGISVESPNPTGGEIVRGDDNEAIGVFEETAMAAFKDAYDAYLLTLSPEENEARWYKSIELAEQNCLENGITSFQDAGSTFIELDRYEKMANEGELDVRLWAMIGAREENLAEGSKKYPLLDVGNNFFTCRAIKAYADGALGAFGAWMLKPYDDKPDAHGQNVTPIPDLKRVAALAYDNDLQMCIHAIGDRANRLVLDIYQNNFNRDTTKKDLRWRIEHAQHINPKDIPRFKEMGVIASMQGIHCTSDAPFVEKRLGTERARTGAYPWRSLLDAGVVIANGTDAPVEDISAIESFYASVTRKRADTGMEFFPEQRMTRTEAINSYTLGNAFAAFEEEHKGSLEIGKLADLVVLSKDLEKCADAEILDAEILMTVVGGEVKYQQK